MRSNQKLSAVLPWRLATPRRLDDLCAGAVVLTHDLAELDAENAGEAGWRVTVAAQQVLEDGGPEVAEEVGQQVVGRGGGDGAEDEGEGEGEAGHGDCIVLGYLIKLWLKQNGPFFLFENFSAHDLTTDDLVT